MTAIDPLTGVTTVTVTINGRAVVANKGEMVIAAADRSGDFIPRFCYHPRLSPVGMCRQCLVEVDTPRGPAMVVSCMTPVADGQVVRTTTPEVKKAQEGIIELLLANHPLDCPVCDKGGECPLQDQAFSHGPGESRFVEEKRHYEKPIPISENVFLDRERCILCDRCTRFADEVAGDPLISFTSRGNATQVMTFPDEPFSSYFSGNTVQICPVGALTARPYRFKARPWDLQQVESTCTTCSVGCRTVVQSSRDQVLRTQGVDSDPVNWGWLCDRGRFDFESLSSPQRLSVPMVRDDTGALVATTWTAAIERAGRALRAACDRSPSSVAILGGARGTNEDAHAWARLADELGIRQRDAQLGDGLPPEVFALPQATIDEVAASPTIVVLAPDLKEEMPVLYLRLRDAARKGARLVEVTSRPTGLTPYAWRTILVEPGTTAAKLRGGALPTEVVSRLAGGGATVVVGRGNVAESQTSVVHALAELLHVSPGVRVLPVLRRANVRGALAAGLYPQGDAPDAIEILEAAAKRSIECLVLLGSDPMTDVADAELVTRAMAAVPTIVAVDTFRTASSSRATVLLPAAARGEKDGSTTNLEGRITEVSRAVTAHGTSRPDWMVAVELGLAVGVDLGFTSVADVRADLVRRVPAFSALAEPIPTDGAMVVHPAPVNIARVEFTVPDRNSYHYRLVVVRTLYDGATSTAHSPSLAELAAPGGITVHPLDLPRVGVVSGDQVRVTSSRGTIVTSVRGDERVIRGTAWITHNRPGCDTSAVIDAGLDVIDVAIEKA